jgi:hypothetical protein
VQPGVIAAAVNLQNAALAREPELHTVLPDECVLGQDCLAKYAAAFFRMSRSSVVRLSSALSFATSACIALRSLDSGWSAFLILLTHVYKTLSGMPSRLTTLTTEWPLPMTCLTASSLNSGANFERCIYVSPFQFLTSLFVY